MKVSLHLFTYVLGDFRKGKSFLMNFMVLYLETLCNPDWLDGDDQKPLAGFKWR
jgi:hypothetical protein